MMEYLLLSAALALAPGQTGTPAPGSSPVQPATLPATTASAGVRYYYVAVPEGQPVPQGAVPVTAPLASAASEPMPAPATPGTPATGTPAAPEAIAPPAPANGEATCPEGPRAEKGLEPGFCHRVIKAYCKEFDFKGTYAAEKKDEEPEPEKPLRAMPDPWSSPPFPTHEFQGYPILGVPPEEESQWPLMQGILGVPVIGDFMKNERINFYGWVTGSGNWATAKNSNGPTSYWVVPNRFELDQVVFRLERNLDSVQTDHWDWGFRSTVDYGMDYRYFTAGGYFSEQLLRDNRLYGWDPTEQYVDVYIPPCLQQGTIIRLGRWIACPDIETQFSPDNYLGSHSILFTYDTYTQSGVMITSMLNKQWIYQYGINAGNDMAPWYKGATPCGYAALRWVAKSNKDSIYTVLNQIDSAEFRHFEQYGQPLGHDNFNYEVTTWEHVFNENIHTATEAYFMWQRNAELGGTPSAGAPQSFGGGGGNGMLLPGTSLTYGVLNYTEFAFTKNDYICLRNEWWRDERGMRSGFPGTYTSNTIGLSHNFNALFQIRPEIGYYRNWTNPAFDLGKSHGDWVYGFDMTLRF